MAVIKGGGIHMKLQKILMVMAMAIMAVLSTTVAMAGDFDWMPDFNIRAEADLSGFRARLSARFNVGDAQITAVLTNVPKPADAYMVLRLGEMSARPPEYVIEQYKSGKGRGWGAIAHSLGIKPGSQEFHALKRGNDLYGGADQKKGKNHGKGKGHGKSKE
jgi:hypothetical protein